MSIHKSVLLAESIAALNLKPGAVVVDATFGAGGHSLEILKVIGPKGKLIAIDQDAKAIASFQEKEGELVSQSKVICFVQDNFSHLKNILENLKIDSVDAILADLGISSDQLADEDKGLSFSVEARLDMRLDKKQLLTAREIVNEWDEKKLQAILKDFGEERFAQKIAQKIIEKRKEKKIDSTIALAEIVTAAIPKRFQKNNLHPATKTFQALRIAVNEELYNLEKFLSVALESLGRHGRLAVITFHSLEDRIVKNVFRQNARGCICPKEFPICLCGQTGKIKIINKKPIIPSPEERQNNRRARSAKLRIAEKI
jgi:16S rRNA (cytosine1402-N4)-methyltransferase